MTRLRRRLTNVSLLISAILPALSAVEISEFMAKNESGIVPAGGGFSDWLEIHNDSGAALDLTGWYLTDDPSNLTKWQFPSTAATSPLDEGGYLLVFADDPGESIIGGELHANFKLNSGGEYLALVEPDGETVAHQYHPQYPPQNADVSYGIDSGSGELTYFVASTPGAKNSAAIAEAVQFSSSSQTFSTSFNLTLSTSSPSASIRYTLDGSMPTASSTPYGSAIPINATTRVRARAFETGLVDGPVTSASFIRLDSAASSFTSDLPVILIENFGQGELPHPDDADRQTCEFMLFEPTDGATSLTNAPTITSRAGLRRRGESTLRSTGSKPNLSVETWGETDEESRSIAPLDFPADSDWVLYAPWTIDTAMIRNPFIYEVSNEAGQYAVRTRYVEVFLNHEGGGITGENDYYGLYILMEKIKQGPDRVDVAKLPAEATSEPDISGGYLWKLDKDDPDDQILSAAGKDFKTVYPKDMPVHQLNWLAGALDDADALIPDGNYESLIDVQSFVDHHILNVFTNNADGLRLSTYYHKDRDGRIVMGPIWDFDRSMACDRDDRASDPEVWSLATNPLHFFHSSSLLWFRSLALDDPDFWILWVDRWQAMREGPLSDEAMIERIERNRSEISAAATRNYERWSGFLSAAEWPGKVDVMQNHVLTRAGWIDDQLIDPPVMSQNGGMVPSGFQLSLSGPETKYVTTDGSDPRASGGSPSGSAYASPITITENTLIKTRAGNGEAFIDAPSTWPWSALTEAMFVVEPAPLAITEVMYHPRPSDGAAEAGFSGSDFEFIEIQNTSASPCSLVGVQFLNGIAFDFTYGTGTTLDAGAYGVLVRNLDAFKARYTNWASVNILGEFDGQLSDGSERLELGYEADGVAALAEFDYQDGWYPSTDGEGFSLVLSDPQSSPSSWNSRAAWRHSSGTDGSPGAVDPAPAYPQGALVINEVLTNQNTPDPGDWIELHNTSESSIDISGWFLSDSRGNLTKYTIPVNTIVEPNGYAVFTELDHFGAFFALSKNGDSVYLSAGGNGVLSEPAYRENVDFGPEEEQVTFGRHLTSDGSAAFTALATPSMGSANGSPRTGPLALDEIMYHPVEGGHEYLVIRNTTDDTVDLYDPANPSNRWKLDGIDFEFPPATQLGSNAILILVRDSISPEQFRTINQIPPSIEILGYAGALDNDADTLALKRPSQPDSQTGFIPMIVIEQVSYSDAAPWPEQADGQGRSLGRKALGDYADDPSNWEAISARFGPSVSTLTVIEGIGDGSYTSGTVATLQAGPVAAGRTFVRWIGNVATVANVESSATTLIMPKQDITISALFADDEILIAEDAPWSYQDEGLDLGTQWRTPEYDDSDWPIAAAQLGYGDGDESNLVDFGSDSDDKHMTTYFRREFAVPDKSALAGLRLELLRDDGAVVFINGTEVIRDNMPEGAIDYLTRASSTVGGESEDRFFEHMLDPGILTDGVNVIAVEIHQRAVTSSDLSFASRLVAIPTVDPSSLDGDADQMHDEWEIVHFGSTEAGIPDQDDDGDRIVNEDEFLAGTLPGDASSFFRIESISTLTAGPGFQINWTPVEGRLYSVEWTSDLRQPFAEIGSAISGGTFIDTEHSTHPTGFYRVEVSLGE